MKSVFLTDIIYRNNIRMGKTCYRLRFCPEFCNKFGICTIFLLQHLNSNITIKAVVSCLIYIRHSACANFFNNFISAAYTHSDFNHILYPLLNGYYSRNRHAQFALVTLNALNLNKQYSYIISSTGFISPVKQCHSCFFQVISVILYYVFYLSILKHIRKAVRTH